MMKHATINRTNQAQQTLQLRLKNLEHEDGTGSGYPSPRWLDEPDSVGPKSPIPAISSTLSDVQFESLLERLGKDLNNNNNIISNSNINSNNNANTHSTNTSNNLINGNNKPASRQRSYDSSSPLPAGFVSAPSPSILSTPSKLRPVNSSSAFQPLGISSNSMSCARSLNFNGNFKSASSSSIMQGHTQNTLNNAPNRSAPVSDSMIKIFAQTLNQDVEYVTMHVNPQTKSQQIIKSLLKKYRLRHRDPNLFYLTLERFIRKDGLKVKSVMLLDDEAYPLQLQQCCSNPPHNDIKFNLQMRAGVLVKIFTHDVVPDTRYKCLSLSQQTTVEETMELILFCLNLGAVSSQQLHHPLSPNQQQQQQQVPPGRAANSPSPTTSSTASSDSSSSGIESDPNLLQPSACSSGLTNHHHQHVISRSDTLAPLASFSNFGPRLDSNSRASSVTSISSSSNNSSISSSLTDQYCLVIECKDTSYRRILESDEYLVDVYQNLLAEARCQQEQISPSPSAAVASKQFDEQQQQQQQQANKITVSSGNQTPNSPLHKQQPNQHQSRNGTHKTAALNGSPINDQWFQIKLKRRDDLMVVGPPASGQGHVLRPLPLAGNNIKFTSPRQNLPLPPIPMSLAEQFNKTDLQRIVSTTQIEVTARSLAQATIRPRPSSSLAIQRGIEKTFTHPQQVAQLPAAITTTPIATNKQAVTANPSGQLSAADVTCNKIQQERLAPPPPRFILLGPAPTVMPRRRNLSNASSTFGRPLSSADNRRRYDPNQLAEDLSKLDVAVGGDINKPAPLVADMTSSEPVAQSGTD